MTTTNTVKKPRRARRRKPKVDPVVIQLPEGTNLTRRKMSEQSYPVKDKATVKPTPKLISRGEYITDFHNRMAIHNYEVGELVKDTKWMYQKVKPYTFKVVDKAKSLYNRLSPKGS